MFVAASALLLEGGFWITVLHHRTTASALTFIFAAILVAVASFIPGPPDSPGWFLTSLSATLSVTAIVLLVRDRAVKAGST